MTEARKRDLAERLAQLSLPAFARPPLPAGGSQLFKKFLDGLDERRKSVAIDTYAERLTVDELDELVRFYESDAGQSFVETFRILDERMRELFQTLRIERMTDEQSGHLGSATLSSADLAKLMEHAKQPPSK